ncbi:small-conductance mechanosensitive channel [Rhizomicrobium palustre]|uniref:Small-conductance mechanosensitive channel n=1 Tax=Rhizomicrobium palustre TaxID=189966 RepID=A0A846N483_9PROT|nr:mechanosensitive ion channel domain-containing protein [Rhizomicrobium palustre]NIK89860.1 small-conductance mechanosensitive channel [Rhizomicrobium palustre]
MKKSYMHLIPAWIPDWVVAVVALALIAVITAIALGFVRMALRRLLPSDRTLTHTVLQHAGGVAQYAFTMLVAGLITPALPLDRGTNQIVERFLFAGFIILLGWVAIIASDLAINRYMSRFHSNTADNLLARKAITQMKLLKRTVDVVIGIITVGFALMTFDAVRQFGVSLFASAGIAGLAVGFAAKPLLENLVAGVQLAITQPFRIDDVVIVNNEWGWIEEINSTYVVVRCWDWRRLVVPLSYMMTNPFQNWTRQSSQLIGTVYIYVNYTTDVERIRSKATEIAKASKLWDGRVINVQVSDISENSMTMQVRILVTSADSGKSWDMRCEMREKIIAWMRDEYPEALPVWREEIQQWPSVPQPLHQAAGRY